MKQLNICCIFGTRPEVIKMAPVIHALEKKSDHIKVHVVCSGQHRELLHPLINWFGLNVDHNLDVMQDNQNLNSLSAKLLAQFGQLFKNESYDCIVAQGDTTTVLMSALAAFHANIPFTHVEAGLRTFDKNLPFPEEMNRVLVGRLASLHFAPTQAAADNLLRENVSSDEILMTGNTVIDALHYTTEKLLLTKSPNDPSKKIILVTVHRRENFGEPLKRICNALLKIAKQFSDVQLIVPVHPNPNVKIPIQQILGNIQNISLIDPLPYDELISIIQKSYLVLTDSGGIQEEAPALKKPVLVMRDETERPELVELGGAILVGSDENMIFDMTQQLLCDSVKYNKMIIGYSPYGNGKAAIMISESLIRFLSYKQITAAA